MLIDNNNNDDHVGRY